MKFFPPFVYRPGSHFFARSSCTRFASEPDKRNASVRRGPGGFSKIHFPQFFAFYVSLKKRIFASSAAGGFPFFGFRRVCCGNEVASAASHRALSPFSISHFSVFLATFSSDEKRLRQSGLVPAMSTFATPFWHASTRVLRFFLAKRVEENH